MDIYLITQDGPQVRTVDELPELLADPENLVWIDLHHCDDAAVAMLRRVFGFHELALRDAVVRNHVAKLHVYSDHAFLVLHSPEIGEHGHVHYVELDQFIGRNYVVTVHGPYAAKVSAETAEQDTVAVLRRMKSDAALPVLFGSVGWLVSGGVSSSSWRKELSAARSAARKTRPSATDQNSTTAIAVPTT